MNANQAVELVASWKQRRVLVIGDVMLDRYYGGRAVRISPEGPVPVVQSVTKHAYPGGASNAAANVRALGGQVHCLGVIGADDAGARLRAELRERGIGDGLLVEEGRCTITKLRILADNQYVVRFDEGEPRPLAATTEAALIAALETGFATCDAVIVADYCYGVLSPAVIAAIGRLKEQHNRLVLVDSKNLPLYRGMAASVITPNHLEAQRALGWNVRDVDRMSAAELEALGQELLASVGSTWALVTLGARGSLLFERGQPTYRIAPRPIAGAHVSGAGDTFTATLALALASGAPVRIAVEVAAEAAAVAVGKPDTATVSGQELLQRLASDAATGTVAGLGPTVADYHHAGKRVVFTNGVFDGLRPGHIAFLRAARALGDVLIVGVNSECGLLAERGYGAQRSEAERLGLVAALEMVDHVIAFDEPTPAELIRAIKPAFHVKGGDYRPDELPEAEAVREAGGEVVILPLFDGQRLSAASKLLHS